MFLFQDNKSDIVCTNSELVNERNAENLMILDEIATYFDKGVSSCKKNNTKLVLFLTQ